MAAADVTARLHAAGLRVTATRVAVYEQLDHAGHISADEIAERLGGGSRQAVYDTLKVFCELGLARRIEPAHAPAALYEARVGDNHHHIVCRSCGAVTDVACVHGAAPCLDPNDAHGYAIDEAEITFWGICPDCQEATTNEESHE
jgi:Fe2+ or Zn2+ uptake regulation protein